MLKQLVIAFALVSFLSVFAFAQDQTATNKKDKQECSKECCSSHESKDTMSMAYSESDSTHGKNHKMKSDSNMQGMHHDMKTGSAVGSSIVREGEIDLTAIDQNKDGKVYQDQMDWNVISDKPGTCPLCGMKLKEVTLQKAKSNLVKNKFKVK